ncbi:MAG: KH domain-containing protein [Coriobacteriia bacterium]|nr:KH domain-containing protein [Coriobacteriia bacterium]MBN2822763.1 KH domain-containing protein [Coriobacteriia bacterium]
MAPVADTDGLVRYIIESLVDNPSDVVIEKNEEGRQTVYEVRVHSDDVGKVIGRQGRVIKAVRTLVRASASVDESDATVEVLG